MYLELYILLVQFSLDNLAVFCIFLIKKQSRYMLLVDHRDRTQAVREEPVLRALEPGQTDLSMVLPLDQRSRVGSGRHGNTIAPHVRVTHRERTRLCRGTRIIGIGDLNRDAEGPLLARSHPRDNQRLWGVVPDNCAEHKIPFARYNDASVSRASEMVNASLACRVLPGHIRTLLRTRPEDVGLRRPGVGSARKPENRVEGA